jgi:hypothetical protein
LRVGRFCWIEFEHQAARSQPFIDRHSHQLSTPIVEQGPRLSAVNIQPADLLRVDVIQSPHDPTPRDLNSTWSALAPSI